ncbi:MULTISPECIES: transcriptional activator NhaR [Vibrio]|jgi:LysR family transcriptional regulator, transcriptional activator of nhaA|uniref:Transcriptional activator protein NhaR n=1 Tax=Vibrio kanaloae TaxID=170673 RepID=A0A4U1Z1S0_9VIBR|nr:MULTISPECIES: transcriptional activator NhaR [Vibrio]KAB0463219.1 transcriptional activator NhaR [Vibrio kanaloae]OEF12181.1 transcriptional activator NhaR [Vibrio kanaloae 5S-149]TKE89653.1 transcriptional activator NhaR [Vibrio kanaloae]TKF13509.1 transcriptional activator NhaR [Vibrio kanaloae]TKF28053.1 transcriptional activator NhaR [Vibrio kanaloae]
MSHLNYNHVYYFWMVCKQGSVTKAAEALFLTPQTVTGQIKALEERMDGKLTKRNGRSVEPTELGQLVFKYADRMFGLSYEMLDIVNYSQHSNILFDVGVADALSKRLVSKILMSTIPSDNSIHLRCFESTHEMLLEQLSQHKLDMILSDCPVDSSQSPGLFSKKLGESSLSFFCSGNVKEVSFPAVLEQRKLLIPGSRTSMGRKVLQWFDRQGLKPDILGEFDDAALMKAFARYHHDAIFLAPTLYMSEVEQDTSLQLLGDIEELKEEYYVIFAERMIQHPAVKNVCDADFSKLFE